MEDFSMLRSFQILFLVLISEDDWNMCGENAEKHINAKKKNIAKAAFHINIPVL